MSTRPARRRCSDPRIGVEWYRAPPPSAGHADDRAVVFLDIDNTLYSKRTDPSIPDLMRDRIRAYFEKLGLSPRQAEELHLRYYRSYGLAIRGLVKHHEIDPLEYDQQCDVSLPLEDILFPNPALVDMIARLDQSKCRIVGLTNAYKVHARRVLDLVGLSSYVEGCIYCDYAQKDFSCKPERDFYLAAMDAVNVRDKSQCYFVDDSLGNVKAAKALGWHSNVFFDEALPSPQSEAKDPHPSKGVDWVIHRITQLEQVWSELFLSQPLDLSVGGKEAQAHV